MVCASTGAVVEIIGVRVKSCLLKPGRCWSDSGLELYLAATDSVVLAICAAENVHTWARIQI